MKLTPGVLHAAFTLLDPESVKKIDNLTVFFTLLGSGHIKAVHRTLIKMTSGRDKKEFANQLKF